jgi:hypothetical protein
MSPSSHARSVWVLSAHVFSFLSFSVCVSLSFFLSFSLSFFLSLSLSLSLSFSFSRFALFRWFELTDDGQPTGKLLLRFHSEDPEYEARLKREAAEKQAREDAERRARERAEAAEILRKLNEDKRAKLAAAEAEAERKRQEAEAQAQLEREIEEGTRSPGRRHFSSLHV